MRCRTAQAGHSGQRDPCVVLCEGRGHALVTDSLSQNCGTLVERVLIAARHVPSQIRPNYPQVWQAGPNCRGEQGEGWEFSRHHHAPIEQQDHEHDEGADLHGADQLYES